MTWGLPSVPRAHKFKDGSFKKKSGNLFPKQENTVAVDKSHCVLQNKRKPLAAAIRLLTLQVHPALFAV